MRLLTDFEMVLIGHDIVKATRWSDPVLTFKAEDLPVAPSIGDSISIRGADRQVLLVTPDEPLPGFVKVQVAVL